jgi:hypothetical protein
MYLESLRHQFPHKDDFVRAQKLQHDRNRHGQRGGAQETRHWQYLSKFIPESSVGHCWNRAFDDWIEPAAIITALESGGRCRDERHVNELIHKTSGRGPGPDSPCQPGTPQVSLVLLFSGVPPTRPPPNNTCILRVPEDRYIFWPF